MADQRFPWSKTFVLGFGFFGISVVWPLFNSFIPPMLEDLSSCPWRSVLSWFGTT